MDLYWGRCGRELVDLSLLRTVWLIMVTKNSTGDDAVGYGAVDLYWDGVVGCDAVYLYWGRCGRKCDDRSLLGTEW